MEDFNSKYTGQQVEDLLDQVASGNAGGSGGGITVETDPVFSASPAATITEEKKAEWDSKYSKPSGGIPKSDLASDVQTTLDNAATFVVAAFDLSAIYSGDDIVYPQKDGLMNAIREGKAVRVPLNKDYLENGYVIAQAYCEDLLYMTIADSHSLINIETSMSDPMLYASDITIHTIANRAAIEKVGELEVVVAKGVDDRGFVYATPTSANGDEDDILLSRDTVKTINGESIFGSGDIEISGGSGEQGPQGDKGDKGDTGVGVQSVEQTTTSSADGGSNIVTVTLTDGTKSTFTVKNGSKGSQGEQGIQGVQGIQGPKGDKGEKGDTGATGANGTNGKDGADGATFTPSVDSAGNLSWSNDKGLANPPTVNIKGPKGDKGDAGEGSGSGGNKEVVVKSDSSFEALSPHIIYVIEWSVDTLFINSFVTSSAPYETYDIIFKTTEMILGGGDILFELPSNVWWANGTVPAVEAGTLYELSIVKTTIENTDYFKAVLTPFKPI